MQLSESSHSWHESIVTQMQMWIRKPQKTYLFFSSLHHVLMIQILIFFLIIDIWFFLLSDALPNLAKLFVSKHACSSEKSQRNKHRTHTNISISNSTMKLFILTVVCLWTFFIVELNFDIIHSKTNSILLILNLTNNKF